MDLFNSNVADLEPAVEEELNLELEKTTTEEDNNNNYIYYYLIGGILIIGGIFLFYHFNDGSNNFNDNLSEIVEKLDKMRHTEMQQKYHYDKDTGKYELLFPITYPEDFEINGFDGKGDFGFKD